VSSFYYALIATLSFLAKNILIDDTPVAKVALDLSTSLRKRRIIGFEITGHALIGYTVILHIIIKIVRQCL
jgi:hypothetical protein